MNLNPTPAFLFRKSPRHEFKSHKSSRHEFKSDFEQKITQA
jgi:hypothetical protein